MGEGLGEGPVVAVVAVIVSRWHTIGTNWIINF